MNAADDYYYTISKNGCKLFHQYRYTGKIAKSSIPANIVDQVKEKDQKLDQYEKIIDIIDKKNKLLVKIHELEKIKQEFSSLNDQLSNMGINTPDDEKMIKINVRIFYEGKTQKTYFNTNKTNNSTNTNDTNKPNNSTNTNNSNNSNNDEYKPNTGSKFVYEEGILKAHQIFTKDDWKKWLQINHIDKGGDPDLCSQIISAGKDMKW